MPKITGKRSIAQKVAYVRSQGQTREHHCHWPGCQAQVPPALFSCKSHWYTLPKELRDKVWCVYQIGQEVSMTPSREYIKVIKEVLTWIRLYHGCKACLGSGTSTSNETCIPCNGSGVRQ